VPCGPPACCLDGAGPLVRRHPRHFHSALDGVSLSAIKGGPSCRRGPLWGAAWCAPALAMIHCPHYPCFERISDIFTNVSVSFSRKVVDRKPKTSGAYNLGIRLREAVFSRIRCLSTGLSTGFPPKRGITEVQYLSSWPWRRGSDHGPLSVTRRTRLPWRLARSSAGQQCTTISSTTAIKGATAMPAKAAPTMSPANRLTTPVGEVLAAL
jgi:hypothetical protein